MARIYLSSPHMGEEERAFLLNAFDSNWIAPLGPHVDAFETEFAGYLGITHAAAISSGTAGLHLALQLLNIRPGDEVFTSTLTFAATANAITYVGARPVFIDSERKSWNLDPELLAQELKASAARGKLPRAVVAVDLYGQCANYDAILEECARYDVPVIEDAAEALGATYKDRPAGTFGAIGVFSFNGNKIITTSGGGMLVSRNPEWVARARFLATQARDVASHYEHSQIGYNYRMSNLLAAVGRGQLRNLPSRVAARRKNNAIYRAALADLPGIDFMPEAEFSRATFWLTCVTVDTKEFGSSRDEVIAALGALDIESRPVWKPMHLQPAFRDCRAVQNGTAAGLFERGLCLPSGSNLTQDDLLRVAGAIRALQISR